MAFRLPTVVWVAALGFWLGVLLLFAIATLHGQGLGLLPLDLTQDAHVTEVGGDHRLGALYGVVQTQAGPGGPQALEGYTYVAPPGGTVDLAIGTIGNVEVSGTGTVVDVRSLQGGGVVTGPAAIGRWSALALFQPRAGGGYRGAVHAEQVNYVTFDNGWSIRPAGARLLICDPSDRCRDF